MELSHIKSLVPDGEHFDESAIGEGMYLTTGHVANIEASLSNASTAQEAIQEKLNNADTLISDQAETISELQTAAEAAATTATQNAETISALKLQVEQLGSQSSGTGTVIAATEDPNENTGSNKLPRYDSPDHPANMAAKRWTGKP